MNIKKKINNKIKLSLPSVKLLNNNIIPKRNSFDDNVASITENNEFWTDCLESDVNDFQDNFHKKGRNNRSGGLKKKFNSVCIESKELQLIKEIDEPKEDTGRKTNKSQFEGYVTFKKDLKSTENKIDNKPDIQNNPYISTCEIISNYNNTEFKGKTLVEAKNYVKLGKVNHGKTKEEIVISKANSTEHNLSNGNSSNSCNKASSKQRDRCLALYDKGKMKSDLNKIIYQKNIEEKEIKLISECTFKPRTNSAMNQNKEKICGKELYDRTVKWKKDQIEKLDKKKKDEQNCAKVYSFKPDLHKPIIQNLFENSKNLSNEKETQKFILRQEKARNEEVKKKARFENLGRVKGNAKPYNLSDNIPTQINEGGLQINHIDEIVKTLRKELQEINLDSKIEIDI